MRIMMRTVNIADCEMRIAPVLVVGREKMKTGGETRLHVPDYLITISDQCQSGAPEGIMSFLARLLACLLSLSSVLEYMVVSILGCSRQSNVET